MSSEQLSRHKNNYKDIVQIFQENLKVNIFTGRLQKTFDDTKLPHNTSNDIMAHDTAETGTTPVSAKVGKRNGSVLIDKHNSSKKAKTLSNDDIKLKFGCSFCSERFSSLVAVRDHTRNNHKKENECRKERKLNGDNSNVDNATEESATVTKLQAEHKSTLLYKCNACKYASISYDQMIEHCQDHLIKYGTSNGESEADSVRQSEPSCMELDVDDDTYNELDHNRSIDSYKFINCDYKLLRSDKWPGNSDKLTKSEMDVINCSSIYYFTRIIRLTSSKKISSAPYMLFECLKCMKYIDPHSMASHVQENSCDEQLKGYPCYVCKLPFLTETSMYLHYKTHQVANAELKYKKIEFNSNDDDHMNAVLLKAAGREMKCAQTRNKPVQQKSDNGKEDGAQNATQQNAGIVQNGVRINNDHETSKDARAMIILGSKTDVRNKNNKTEIADNVAKSDKVVAVYKCQCGLCFHILDNLFNHLENCPSKIIVKKKTCACSLVFDEHQYELHCKIHSLGYTQFIVKKVTVSDEEIISLDMEHKEEYVKTKNATTTSANKDRVDTKNTDNNTTIDKTDQDKQSKVISALISSILKIPDMLAHVGDSKTVEETQEITDSANTEAENSKRGDLIGESVVKSGELAIAVAKNVHETNEEGENTKQKKTSSGTNITTQSEINVNVTDVVDNSNQQISDVNKAIEISVDVDSAHNPNEMVHSESGNTEENQSTFRVEVELAENNIYKKSIEDDFSKESTKVIPENVKNDNISETKHDEDNKTVIQKDNDSDTQDTLNIDKNQVNEEMDMEEKANNECDECIENNEEQRDAAYNSKDEKTSESRVYTEADEEELLNETGASKYTDAELLTDDEDTILLYDDDDEIFNQENAE